MATDKHLYKCFSGFNNVVTSAKQVMFLPQFVALSVDKIVFKFYFWKSTGSNHWKGISPMQCTFVYLECSSSAAAFRYATMENANMGQPLTSIYIVDLRVGLDSQSAS